MKSYKVVTEHDDHLYKAGTIVSLLYSFGNSIDSAWYVDDEGIMQILYCEEVEEVV